MKKTIILHGHLRDKYPQDIVVEADTVAEAVRALETVEELTPPAGMVGWPVTIENINSDIALFSTTSMDEIHIYPQLEGGGGRGGFLQILVGVALIATGIGMGAGATILGGLVTSGSIATAGAMMVLGGILQVLAPTPDLSTDNSESASSRYLGAGVNTVKIGTRIPLAYGNNKLGGHYLSFDVDSVEWAGDDEPVSGTSELVGDSVYVEHDKPAVQAVPVHPIFTESVASPTNTPTAGWAA